MQLYGLPTNENINNAIDYLGLYTGADWMANYLDLSALTNLVAVSALLSMVKYSIRRNLMRRILTTLGIIHHLDQNSNDWKTVTYL